MRDPVCDQAAREESERVLAAFVREGDTIRVDVLSEWAVVVGRVQRGYEHIDLYFDDGPGEAWQLRFRRAELVERSLKDEHGVSLIAPGTEVAGV